MKLFLTTVAVIFSIIMTLSSSAELVWLDKVIVLVEDDVILDSEFKRKLMSVKQQIIRTNTELPSDEALKKQVLERLIMDQIQLQLASRAGVRISDAELNAALERVAESGQTSLSEMKRQLEIEGINYSIFREDVRNEMLISRVRQGTVSQSIFVSEQEIDDIIKLMDSHGETTTQYHLRHLMITISESASPNEVDEARAKMDSIIERFNNGEDFTQLIILTSDGANALKGGDLGWRTIEQLPTLFAGSVGGLSAGTISAPIRSPNGLHVLKLEEKKGGFETQLVAEVMYRQILIKLSTITTDNKAEARLIDIRKNIVEGTTDFAEQAKVYSEDLGTSANGGEMLWAPPSAYKNIYSGNTDELKDGEMSIPFKSGQGWYLVELMGSRTSDLTDEKKRERALRILQSRKFEEEQETWLREIREQAFVKILDKK